MEELFASGSVTPLAASLAMIEDIGAEEVRAVFERMLARVPALAITGKGATARTARRLADLLADGGEAPAVPATGRARRR